MSRNGASRAFSQNAFLLSVFVTSIGNACAFILCGKVSLDSFGLASVFGALLLLEQIKSIALGTFSGIVVDRCGAKNVAVAGDIILGLIELGAIAVAASGASRWAVLGSFFLINLVKPFYNTAIFALTRRIASIEELYSLNARTAIAQQLGYFLGLTVVGLLVIKLAPTKILFIDAASYLISAAALFQCVEVAAPLIEAGRRASGQILKSIRHIVASHNGLFIFTVVIAMQINLLMLYNTSLFKLVEQRFPQFPMALSSLEGIYSLAIVITSWAVSRKPAWRQNVSRLPILFLFQAATFCLMGRVSYLPLFAILVATFGCLSSLIFPASFAALQAQTPQEHLGKVGGLRGVVQGLLAVPVLLVHGSLLDLVGLAPAYLFMMGLCILLAIASLQWSAKWKS